MCDPEPDSDLHAEVAALRGRLAMLDAMREGLQILDHDLRYLYVNTAAAEHGHTTRESLLGHTLAERYPGVEHTEMYGRLLRCVRERVSQRMENEFTYPDGTTEWFELRMEPIPEGVLILSIDMGQRRRLEAQLRHAQKMEAVGRLAGGIAHDFNNLLTIISAYTGFIGERLPEGSPLADDLTQVRLATERGAALTTQLLALGRRQVTTPQRVQVGDALTAIQPMIERLVGDGVTVRLQLGSGACAIRIDPGQLDQVLLNLAANARDAMPDGGTLTLRVEEVVLDEDYTATHLATATGRHVLLAVSDTGTGMDAVTRSRIFEPFFTTKAPGHGTGLGLATSHGIITQAGGHLWVYSEVGQGTTFKLYFPAISDQAIAAPPPLEVPGDLRGTQTLLVVDDNDAIRDVCARSLSRYGYTVLQADGLAEAVRFAGRFSGTIDLVLTDLVMPGGRGAELVERLREDRPEIRAIFMSGFVDEALLATIDPTFYLEKPFTPSALARRVRQVLDG